MEVHHHPQVEKKSFKEYLLEGLMIFLAVSMGFIAENIRENLVEHETEKRTMELVVENLKEDTTALEKSIKWNIKKVDIIDSILLFRNSDLGDSNTAKKFMPLFGSVMTVVWFQSNNSGFEQMKSSGTIRIVKQKRVLDSLYKYKELNRRIEFNGDIDNEPLKLFYH